MTVPGKAGAWLAVLPGAALALALALTAKIGTQEIGAALANGRPSPVSPVLVGIVIGVLWRHFIGVGARTEAGVRWILGTLLLVGIALVGLRLTLPGLAGVGRVAIPVVVVCILVALAVSQLVGRAFGLSAELRRLLAVGSAVCGCTAIVATAPVIRARAIDTGTALTCVVLIGSTGMLLYPWIAALVFGTDPLPAGVFLGSAIHDTSQVIGASLIYSQQFASPDAVAVASATKLLRNLSIIVLVPLFGWLAHAETTRQPDTASSARRRPLVPWFIVAFVALVVVRALGDQFVADRAALAGGWGATLDVAQTLSELFMICGMTAVGLNLSLANLGQVGMRPFAAALVIAVATAACSLGLTALILAVA
ncbi:MAG TPA: putative sulfate exporter family transporter [Steroidobacteraceae bacterium]|nr:putative sulfate exporter family transporter [Steroidobacteraceae bacterium]HNS27346.1 putative sulfate exporter family transporter [Steroidobacteraceae bacterium]